MQPSWHHASKYATLPAGSDRLTNLSIVAHVYLEISMLPPPTIPRHFERPSGIFSHGLALTPNVDMFGNRHTRQSKSPPFVPGAIHLACDVALMLYSSMQWNMESEGSYGSEEDLRVRRRKLDEVREWIGRLPLNMQCDVNFTPQTYYLRCAQYMFNKGSCLEKVENYGGTRNINLRILKRNETELH